MAASSSIPLPGKPQRALPVIDMRSEEARERLRRQFRYAQVGQCVSSVTHDLNNFLGAIMAYAELVQLDSNLGPDSTRMVNEIVEAVRKSSALVNNLTDVARRERPDVRSVDPGLLIERALDLRRYDAKVAHIALDVAVDPGLPSLTVDLPKVQQALLYLLSNAVESAAEAEHRLIRVRVTGVDDTVETRIWDSGGPVPEEDRERVFEPFFTTKAENHLGLGLTIARETARRHGGDVSYDPEDGFRLILAVESPIAVTQ